MTSKVPTPRMIRDAWEQRRAERHRTEDTLEIVDGCILINGSELKGVYGLQDSRPLHAGLDGGIFADPRAEVTINLSLHRKYITGGRFGY